MKKAPSTYAQTVQDISINFKEHGKGFDFTYELAEDHRLQLLDINIPLEEESVCSKYCPRARKELLPCDSAHSKTIKRAIALTCLQASLRKSCCHKAHESFECQVRKLQAAGYPSLLISSAAEAFLKKMK